MSRIWRWFLAIVIGLVFTLGGLFWDAVIHTQEHEHIAAESLLNLRNPGHAVFGLGLVLTTVVVLTGFTVSWLAERRGDVGWQLVSVPAILWLLVGLMGVITLASMAQTG